MERSQFKYWGAFLKKVHAACHLHQVDPRLVYFDDKESKETHKRELDLKDLTGATGTDGGFLIPDEFLAQLQAAQNERAVVRPRATVIPMRRRTVTIPVLDQTGITAGQPHWFGGIQMYWADEAEQKGQSQPKFRFIRLDAHKLVGYTVATDELLDDAAIGLEAFLSGPLGFAGAAAWMEDFVFVQGDGIGKPLGILNAPATLTQTRASGGTIAYADLVDMLAKFLPSSGQGIWLASQSAMPKLMLMEGPSGNPSFLWGDATNGRPNSLLGLPIVFTEKMPVLGSKGDICLADWSYYLIGDRQAVTVDSSMHELFRYDKTSWRVVERIDGKPWLSAPLTYQDGTTQVSPFVALAA